jgi:hypothetical protein
MHTALGIKSVKVLCPAVMGIAGSFLGGIASKFAYKPMFKSFKTNFTEHPRIFGILEYIFKNTFNFGINCLVISSFFKNIYIFQKSRLEGRYILKKTTLYAVCQILFCTFLIL